MAYWCRVTGRCVNIMVTPDRVSVWYFRPLDWTSMTWAEAHWQSSASPRPAAPRSRFMRPYYDKYTRGVRGNDDKFIKIRANRRPQPLGSSITGSATSMQPIGTWAPPQLVEHAIQRREGNLSADGALVVRTGQFTGRSPKDKFIVRDEITDADACNGAPVNQPMSRGPFRPPVCPHAGVLARARRVRAGLLRGRRSGATRCLSA